MINIFNETIEEIHSLQKLGIKLGLLRVRKACEVLGNPQEEFPSVIVGGTNGKGSVSAMLYSMLSRAGYMVGLFTSPHTKEDFRSRIVTGKGRISRSKVVEIWERIRRVVHLHNLTFFEAVTLIAFEHFREEGVEIAILEVGLGGRLDATNISRKVLSVITNVALEHTRILGSTIGEIAYEKAGIIGNAPVVTAASGIALRVIKETANKRKVPLILVDKKKVEEYESFNTSLEGGFQKINKAVAIEAIRELSKRGWVVKEDVIRRGLLHVKWPCRFERMFVRYDNRSVDVTLDCAHNPSGMLALVNELKHEKREKLVFLVAILRDKNYKKMVRCLAPLADTLVVTQAENERSLPPFIIADYASSLKEIRRIIIEEELSEALAKALKLSSSFVVAGSCFLSEPARKLLTKLK